MEERMVARTVPFARTVEKRIIGKLPSVNRMRARPANRLAEVFRRRGRCRLAVGRCAGGSPFAVGGEHADQEAGIGRGMPTAGPRTPAASAHAGRAGAAGLRQAHARSAGRGAGCAARRGRQRPGATGSSRRLREQVPDARAQTLCPASWRRRDPAGLRTIDLAHPAGGPRRTRPGPGVTRPRPARNAAVPRADGLGGLAPVRHLEPQPAAHRRVRGNQLGPSKRHQLARAGRVGPTRWSTTVRAWPGRSRPSRAGWPSPP